MQSSRAVGQQMQSLGGFLTGERVVRRLAAIMAADVAAYSRLMGRDEYGTLASFCLERAFLQGLRAFFYVAGEE